MLLLRGTDPIDHLTTGDRLRQAVIGRACERATELRQHELEFLAAEIARATWGGRKASTAADDAADPP